MWDKAKIVWNLRIESQSMSKAWARSIFDFWAQMEARIENMSGLISIRFSMQIRNFWAPTQVVWTKYSNFDLLGPLALMASPDHRDHKVDQVEIVLMGPPGGTVVFPEPKYWIAKRSEFDEWCSTRK